MDEPLDTGLNVAMFAPWHARCGIRDYTAHLVQALDALPEIASTRIVAAPPDAARGSLRSALAHRREDAERFRLLGRAMNAGADVAHVQHQYFLFGGVSPIKSHVRSFLDEVRVPVALTVHEIAEPRGGIADRALVAAANRMNFRHPAVRVLIVHTEADRQRLLSQGLPERRLRLIRLPAPLAEHMPELKSARRLLESVFPALIGRRAVTLFGFLSAKKGHGTAIEALSALPEDIVLVLAGGQHPDDHTDYVVSLRREIDRLGMAQRTIITGYLPEEQIPALMAITEVAIAPFLRTSGSASLADLLASGRPVVASDIGPHRELLAESPGLLALVPPGDPGRLAEEVRGLLDDAPRREALRHAALAYAAEHTYAAMARATLAVYRAIRNEAA
jgi:glycosyltransferase involved in cell wall biosynthesis